MFGIKIKCLSACALLVLSVLLCACNNNVEPSYDFTKVTAQEAKKMIDEGGYTVLDVRTQEEYDEKHIPGCVHVIIDKNDVSVFKDEIVKAIPDKNKKIIVYCKSGFRSEIASKAMCTLGYTCIYDMTDGIEGWTFETE